MKRFFLSIAVVASLAAIPASNALVKGHVPVKALVHGSELRADPSSPPGWGSRHSVAVGHPEPVHRVEDAAREPHLSTLPLEGSTSHASTDDRPVSIDGVLDQAAPAVA